MTYGVIAGWIWVKHVQPVLERETGRPPYDTGPAAVWRHIALYGKICSRDSLGTWRYRLVAIG
jgi:hypothetical protein